MKMNKYFILTVILVFIALCSNAQTPLNGRFYITGASEVPTTPGSNYTIEGKFTDLQFVYTADDIRVGDVIADNLGLTYRIDKIISVKGDLVSVDVTYLKGAALSFLTYPASYAVGTLFRPTSKGYALGLFDQENNNESLKIALLNSAVQDIDRDIRGFHSGADGEIPKDPKFGDTFYNTTEKKLYAFTENGWVPLGSGVIASGTAAQFPNPAKAGEMYLNKDDNSTYIYNGTVWYKISTNGSTPSGSVNPDPAVVSVREGNLFHNTSDHKLYVYNGTNWIPVDNTLRSGYIYVGNASNVAISTALTGDATMSNTGKLTIKEFAISNEKLDKSNIPLSGFDNPSDHVSMGDGTAGGNFKIINLANPSKAFDAVNKSYVDELFKNPNILALPSEHFFVGSTENKAVPVAKNLIPISGFDKAYGNLVMGTGLAGGNFKIVNVADPAAAQDVATKNYVDTKTINPSSIMLLKGSLLVGSDQNTAAAVAKSTIPLSGFAPATDDIVIGGVKLTGLADPGAAQDAATKKYVDNKVITPSSLSLTTGNLFVGDATGKAADVLKNTIPISGFAPATANLNLGGFTLTDLRAPLVDADAVNKKYVDQLFKAPDTLLGLPKDHLFVGSATGKAMAIPKNKVPVSGFSKAIDDIVMGDAVTRYKITFLDEPSAATDAATKGYVDSKTSNTGSLVLPTGHLLIGDTQNKAVAVAKSVVPLSDFAAPKDDLSIGNFKLIDLADPTADKDAATKKYVDSKTIKTPTGTTPTAGAVAGDTYYNTADNHYYVYNGTSWVPTDNKLAASEMYVGNAAGIATSTAKDAIPLSGFGTPQANISMGNGTKIFKIVDLEDPSADQDAATKKYVDAGLNAAVAAGKDNLGNHIATKNISLAANAISNDGVAGKGLTFDAAGNAVLAQNLTLNGNFYTPSDRRLKTDIETLSNVLQKIEQIRGVKFEYKDQRKYATGVKIGVIAQELQKVYPEMVTIGKDGFFKVDYTQLTGVLIQAVKEQQKEIEELKSRMDKQQGQIDSILKRMQ